MHAQVSVSVSVSNLASPLLVFDLYVFIPSGLLPFLLPLTFFLHQHLVPEALHNPNAAYHHAVLTCHIFLFRSSLPLWLYI